MSESFAGSPEGARHGTLWEAIRGVNRQPRCRPAAMRASLEYNGRCSDTRIGREGISQVSIQIFEQFCEHVSHGWLVRVATHVLAEAASPTMAASIVIADDETLRELNARHRGVDDTTDVLAFSYTHQGEYYGDGGRPAAADESEQFVTPPADSLDLGEVIISYPQAERQAAESGHSITEELATLLAHGILHLLGYDHTEPDDEMAMEAEEARVLSQVPQHD